VKKDDITDPSLSQESWWADLKSELTQEDVKKRETSEDSVDWWSDLKEELSSIEEKN